MTLFIALYTSRVVLEKLGADDFGIFNLVAGFITIFSFLQGSASAATMRYLTFEIGRGDNEKLRRTFATSLALHLGLCAIVVVLAETVGLWFVNTQLEIAPERMQAANIVYQISVFSLIITIMQIPFTAIIMARERLDVYALLMLALAFLKLTVALVLVWFVCFDTLVVYALLYGVVTLLVGLAFAGYGLRNFRECRVRPGFHKGITAALLSFSGYDSYGNFCSVARIQGMSVILNRFGGTVLNAASALAANVSSALLSFSNTIILAFKPQMTKEYAAGEYSRASALVYNCARFSFLLVGVMMVPLFVEMDYVLKLWLGNEIPPYTADFCRICVLTTCLETVNGATSSGIHATGVVKRLSLICGTLALLELPAMIVALRLCAWAPMVYAAHFVFVGIIMLVNAMILRKQMPEFSIRCFIGRSLLTPAVLLVLAMAACIGLSFALGDGFGRLAAMCGASLTIVSGGTYFFLLSAGMRASLRAFISSKLNIIHLQK